MVDIFFFVPVWCNNHTFHFKRKQKININAESFGRNLYEKEERKYLSYYMILIKSVLFKMVMYWHLKIYAKPKSI
jgi:hypothetical protein